jgi:hypothetical protein
LAEADSEEPWSHVLQAVVERTTTTVWKTHRRKVFEWPTTQAAPVFSLEVLWLSSSTVIMIVAAVAKLNLPE